MNTIVRSFLVVACLVALIHFLRADQPPEVYTKLESIILKDRAESYWNTYYETIGNLVEKERVEVFVEIGTGWGGLPVYLLQRFPRLYVVAIDPFRPNYDEGDIHAAVLQRLALQYNLNEDAFSNLFAQIYRNDAARFGGRYRLIHDYSANAEFAPESIDCLFVDGLHTERGVRQDIDHFLPFVRANGPIVFNDYPQFPGVVAAVDSFANRTNQIVVKLDANNVLLRNV